MTVHDRHRTDDPYHWEARVDAWEEVATSDAFLTLRDHVLALAEPRPDDRVVDLGAGTGLLALAFAPEVAEVTAVDASSGMLERLDARAAADGVGNVVLVEADLRRLPLPDESATLVVSNYAFHHLDDAGKELALSEARRVLQPGGRLVICDMMFTLSLQPRDRRVVRQKLSALARRGPAGLLRIARNAGRVLARRWEQPATADTWRRMLADRGFDQTRIELLENEAGILVARRPGLNGTAAARARGFPTVATAR